MTSHASYNGKNSLGNNFFTKKSEKYRIKIEQISILQKIPSRLRVI